MRRRETLQPLRPHLSWTLILCACQHGPGDVLVTGATGLRAVPGRVFRRSGPASVPTWEQTKPGTRRVTTAIYCSTPPRTRSRLRRSCQRALGAELVPALRPCPVALVLSL